VWRLAAVNGPRAFHIEFLGDDFEIVAKRHDIPIQFSCVIHVVKRKYKIYVSFLSDSLMERLALSPCQFSARDLTVNRTHACTLTVPAGNRQRPQVAAARVAEAPGTACELVDIEADDKDLTRSKRAKTS
jgi:hypothetical protein